MHRKRTTVERRKRRQRAATAAAGRQVYRSAPGIRTWATNPLAMAVSGRGAVAVLVQSGPCTWLIGVRISLLAGGYLGTSKRRVAGDITLDGPSYDRAGEALPSWGASEEVGRRLFGGRHQAWGRHLRPAPVCLASSLIWGAVAYGRSRGVSEASDELPALGHVPPPPGHLAAWCADFVRRFDASQVAVADATPRPRPARGGSGARPPGSVSSTLSPMVDFELETEMPLTAYAAFDRHPTDLVPLSRGCPVNAYRWMSERPERLSGHGDALSKQACGTLWLDSRGRLTATVHGVIRASALAMRISDLVPSFRLRACRWRSRTHEEIGDEQPPGQGLAVSPAQARDPGAGAPDAALVRPVI